MKLHLILLMVIAAVMPTVASANPPRSQASVVKQHQGRWLGKMTLPDGRALNIGVELLTRADGSAWASFASPDQAAYDMPVKSVVETGQRVDLDIGMATMSMTWSADHFDGAYAQNGPPLAFVLDKVAQFPRRRLPQPPKGPISYKDEQLAIASGGDVVLGATLSLPQGKAGPTAVVLVAGSGPVARDGGVAGHQAFLVMADYLASRGIAVLRYDKRGVARSTGNYEQHTVAQLADDLSAVLHALKDSKRFGKIGVIGVSEGPGIAAAVAARDPAAVDFVVSLAGGG